ncbi:MAG: 50S ribosomal protein L16 [Candidatus Dojkabacteria bacterium]|nr:50S ribosomal protein L16 [Candidatus Dojkabacteria bacterium]
MLEPKNPKFRKRFRGKMKGIASAGSEISFGEYALQAKECANVSARQIESARRAIVGHAKRRGKVWIRIFPDKPYTKKPAEVKMGSGKGDVEGYVAVVKPGRILFEVGGLPEDVAREAFRIAGHKLSVKVRFVKRDM